VPSVQVSLRMTRRQLRALRDTLEMEVDRTIDNEGFLGCEVDERENLECRCDLLAVLLQLSTQAAPYQETTNANH